MKAHFGHIAYDITFTDEPIPVSEEDGGGEAVGISFHRERRIEVLKGGEMTQEYAANTLLHEILHAACSVVGFHPDNEEEIASALAAGLSLFLRDARNERALAELIPALGSPQRIYADNITVGKVEVEELERQMEEVTHQGMWQVPDEGPKFGRLKARNIDEQVRSDFAGLAAAAAEGAETVAPPTEPELGSGRPVCGHRYVEDGEREICKKAPIHRGIHGPREGE